MGFLNFCRLKGVESSKSFEELSVDRQAFAPDFRVAEPATAPCADCGGIYRVPSLKTQQRVNVQMYYNNATEKSAIIGIATKVVYYCEFCEPYGDIAIILNDIDDGNFDDIKTFNVLKTGYFQEIDDEKGVLQFSISSDRYDSITCAECSEDLKCTKCRCTK